MSRYTARLFEQKIPLKPITEQAHKILADWCRLTEGKILIDGVEVQELVRRDRGLEKVPKADDNLFPSEDSLKDFFKKHLLKNVAAENQDEALKVLMDSLHQGKWQRPISASTYEILSDISNGDIGPMGALENRYAKDATRDFLKKHLPKDMTLDQQDKALEVLMNTLHEGKWQRPISAETYKRMSDLSKGDNSLMAALEKSDPENLIEDDLAQERTTNITTTSQGFSIREDVTQYKCRYAIQAERAGETILPDPGNKFIYQARATIDLNFKKGTPVVTLKDTSIQYGNKEIKDLIKKDKNFFDRVSDFINKIINVVFRKEEHPTPRM